MQTRRIIVLAFSYKRGAHCVAGREVIQKNGQPVIGPWIRPVSSAADGALEPQHYVIRDGSVPRVLDIVDVPVTGPTTDPGQPENWRIDESVRWKRVGTYDAARVPRFAESPPDLWLEAGGEVNRISAAAQAQRSPQASLVLVAPRNLRLRMSMELKEKRGQEKPRTEALFDFAGREYALTITDPPILDLVRGKHPAAGRAPVERRLTCRDRCLFCVSLTPPWMGYHYKVVATILGLP